MEWMILPLKRYAEFSGRSRRKEYWMFFLFNLIIGLITGLVDVMLGLTTFGTNTIATLALLIPGLAVAVRRLHDIDRTGWWILLPILPLIGLVATAGVGAFAALGGAAGGMPSDAGVIGMAGGVAVFGIGFFIAAIVLLVFYCLDGTRGPNRFGPDPKNPEGDLGEVFS